MKVLTGLLLSYLVVTLTVVESKFVDKFDLKGGDYRRDFVKLPDDDCLFLRFQVKSTNGVYIQFSSDDGPSDESYVAMIGAGGNKNTCLRKGTGDSANFLIDERTWKIINGKWQYFYIKQKDGYWEIGREGSERKVIASGKDSDVYPIRYFRVRSDDKSWWRFIRPGLGQNTVYEAISKPDKYVWHFPEVYFPDYPGKGFRFVFGVRAVGDVFITFSEVNYYGDDIYEMMIGARHNLFSCFRRKKDGDLVIDKTTIDILDKDEMRYFWVEYDYKVLKFGRWGSDEAIYEYEDPNPLDIRYFGIKSKDADSRWEFFFPCAEPFIVCQNDDLKLECPGGFIKIKEALFGRQNKAYCRRAGEGYRVNSGCGDPEKSYQVVYDKCWGKEECTVEITNEVFTNPCPGTYKYLRLDYECCKCD